MSHTVPTREVAFGLAVIGFCIAAFFGWIAITAGTLSSWPDQESPHFVLAAGSQGSWEPRWEPTIRRHRDRVLVLRYVGTDAESRPRELDLLVRVEPHDALHDSSREQADGEGWIRHAIQHPGILGIAEPALVRRIEWKIGNVQPSTPPFQAKFCVHGDPDPEHPVIWPFAAFVSLLALSISSVLMAWARKSGSRTRRATFDLI